MTPVPYGLNMACARLRRRNRFVRCRHMFVLVEYVWGRSILFLACHKIAALHVPPPLFSPTVRLLSLVVCKEGTHLFGDILVNPQPAYSQNHLRRAPRPIPAW